MEMDDRDSLTLPPPPAADSDLVTQLIEELVRLGVGLSLDDGRLRLSAARGVIDEALQGRLVEHKEELVRRVQARSAASPSVRIEPCPQDDHIPFPLSDLQLGFYAANDPHMEYHVRPHAYLETDGGPLDAELYEAAWNAALMRHRRELCVVNAEVALQTLVQPAPVRIRVYDLRELRSDEVTSRLEAVRVEMMRSELPLDRWPWFDLRISLWHGPEGERSRIHYNHNSYFIDGLGTSRLLAEVERRCHEPGFDPPPPALSYRDAVLGLERLAASAQGQAARSYWFDRLPLLPPPPELPQKPGMNRRVRSRLERREGLLDKDRWKMLKARASHHGLTPSNTLIAAYACVVAAWSGNDHFIFSQMVTRRLTELHPDMGDLLGNFASLYPLEVQVRPVALVENARALQERVLQDMRHLAFGGMQVLQQLNRLKGSFGSAPSPFVVGSGLFIKRYRKQDFCVLETSQTLLDHQFFELDDGSLHYVWDLLEEFFQPGVIDTMWGAYQALLQDLADGEDAWVQPRRDFLPAHDRAERDARNATNAPLSTCCLHEPLAIQAMTRPGAPVLMNAQGVLDYGTLARWSDAVASELVARGVLPGDRVAVLLDRTQELMAAVFGVLKAGAAYVPLDPALPAERLAFVLADIGGRVALVSEAAAARADWPPGVAALLVPPRESSPAADWQPARASATDLAYVIYTSGSTGRPKGVMIDHRGAVNTIEDINRRFSVGPDDKVFGISAFNFDLSVYDIYGVVAAGATLVYPDPPSALDPAHALDWMAREAVTVWNSVPALMSLLVETALARGVTLPALRLVMLSGDKIPIDLPAAIRRTAPAAQLVSLGGATEASIWSIYYPFDAVDPAWVTVPYGFPLDNQTWHVRDRHGRDCPTWVPGELYIGGIGLALGYWNDEDKTQRSFLGDAAGGGRLYRTGDVGRYLPGGCIEWIGRADLQVKINGNRIELGEIESVLAGHPVVTQAVVTVQQFAGSVPRLVAHLCAVPGASLQPQELEAFLSRTLPAYMVPTAWRFLEALPLTSNGKVDRLALAQTNVIDSVPSSPARPYAAPSTAAETRLQALWQKVLLRAEPIGVDDDFFDLGGQSFDAIRIFAAIKDESGQRFTLGDLWRTRTIRELARAMAASTAMPQASEVVRLNSVADGQPLFLVHPAGGSVLGYMPLGRLLQRPLLGLQAPPAGSGAPLQSIESRAARYVELLRRAQPEGPYALGGWSSGALIAYEMAARLEAAGQTVSQLLLLDGPTPQPQLSPTDDMLLAWFIQDLGQGLPVTLLKDQPLAGLALHEQLGRAAALLGGTAGPGFALEDLEPAFAVFRDVVLAGCRYRPPGVQAPITVVRVEVDLVDEFALHPALARPDWGWGDFARGRVRCLRAAGHHHSFLAEPVVRDWYGALDATDEPPPAMPEPTPATPGLEPKPTAMHDDLQELLATLSSLGVSLEQKQGRLHVSAPPGVVDAPLQRRLAHHRDALVERLSAVEDPPAELQVIVPKHADRHLPFPLNHVQHAYWIGRSSHVESGSVSTHFYAEFDCPALDAAQLSRALRKAIARHGMLRGVVNADGRQQVLQSVPEYTIAELDLRSAEPARCEQMLQQVRAEMSHQVLPCDRWPLFDVRLISLPQGHSRLCTSWDFLMVDAWSMLLIFRNWHEAYLDPTRELAPLSLSFRDYVLAERELKHGQTYRRSHEYWWSRLDELPLGPQLPVIARATQGRPHFTRRQGVLPAAQWDSIKAQARALGITASSLLLAAFCEVLNRWSRSRHYCLNLTLFNRLPMHGEVNELVGDFTNLLVFEVEGGEGGTFAERALAVQRRFLRDFEHRAVSAVEVLREMARRRALHNRALLPVVFTSTLMLDGSGRENSAGLERFGPMSYGISQTPQVWLDHQIFEFEGRLVYNWDAVDELFLPGVLDDMFAAQVSLLNELAASPEAWRQAVVLAPDGHAAVRRLANDTDAERPAGLLHEPFIAQALRHPGRIALEFAGGRMSYGELLARSAALAQHLQGCGAQPNQLVAVAAPKGWEQVVGVMGVLMSGAAYLPVDVQWPARRREQVLLQAEVRIAVTVPALRDTSGWPMGVECVCIEAHDVGAALTQAPQPRQRPDDLAYVIFTSGSTGVPKGVMIDHTAALNTVMHINRLFDVVPDDVVLGVSELHFDLSVYDIFGLLGAGGTLVLPDPALSRDPAAWHDLLRRHRVSVWNSVPQLMGMLVDTLEEEGDREAAHPLRLALLSGDWIPPTLPGRVRALNPATNIISLGGATEGAVWSIFYPVGEVGASWDSIPYGKALPNQHMYVLDEQMRERPTWVTGDIYIGGAGVALGYWKDVERTARHFMRHPQTGEPLYYTGDLGRWMPDGNIEFLGRDDGQVKIRGHRVELGEVAACIRSHPDVRDAVARLLQKDQKSTLAAYVVLKADASDALLEREAADPAWTRAARALVRDAGLARRAEAPREPLLAAREVWAEVEAICARAMLEAVDGLGLLGVSDSARGLAACIETGEVLPWLRSLVQTWLGRLVERGDLLPEGGGHRVADAAWAGRPAAAALIAALKAKAGAQASLADYLALVESFLLHHRDLLAGRVQALDLMFPGGSLHLADAQYRHHPVAAFHNQMIAALVRAIAQSRDGAQPLRVLEISAGSGAISAAVLPTLPPHAEYRLTDVSSFFFDRVRREFAGHANLTCSIFDLNRDPGPQGLSPHGFDVVVAANLSHNATDLGAALSRLRGLLRPGGWLVSAESTGSSLSEWATAGFFYGDSGAPPPTLTQWLELLAVQGFEDAHPFPGDLRQADQELAALLASMPLQVLAARGPASVARFKPAMLSAYLAERLPAHMVPQHLLPLPQLPLTTNGKVDLKALPAPFPAATETGRTVVKPRAGAESLVLDTWKQVLGRQDIGAGDNFFDIGGDSLLLAEVMRRLNRSVPQRLSIADLFANPTVQSLARQIEATPPRAPATAAPVTTDTPQRPRNRDIAIIGLAGRFPGAADADALWSLVAGGGSAIRDFTDDELRAAGVSEAELAQPGYVKAGAAFEGIERFDAAYFGITPREAEVMDPQQRLLLECAVEALDAAGYAVERDGSSCGVFVGKGTSLYLLEHVLQHSEVVARLGLLSVLNVNEKDHLATLLSYKLDLTGPSIAVNTACSTSLVAVHLACRSLLGGECEIALAGGVSLVSTLERFGYVYEEGHILSPDGRCRAFGDEANGSVFGSGVGLVVLKQLDRALADGDHIRAVIKGTAVNNDGSLKVGYTAPSAKGQAAVIAAALQAAGVAPESIQCVEAHGTGTKLGDPIEFSALHQVFGGPRADGSRVALGSIKTNIGHLDAAAGVAGLIKMVLAMEHEQVPPSLHAAVTNRNIGFAESPFYVPGALAPWPRADGPRRAGVSSFGVGGTNAHLVLEEAPRPAHREPAAPPRSRLLMLSARTADAVVTMARQLAATLEQSPRDLADVAYTLQSGRATHRHRVIVVAASAQDAATVLKGLRSTEVALASDGPAAPVVFMFPGQGSQRRGAFAGLHDASPAFKEAVDACADIVNRHAGWDLRAAMQGIPMQDDDGATLDMDQTSVTQPVVFASGYATACHWRALGVEPAAMLGHSLGEYVAACLAGVFSLEEAMSLVLARGHLLQSLERGEMHAVSCDEGRLQPLLAGSGCSLAAVNASQQCVVSGPVAAMAALLARLEAEGLDARPLHTSHAFHSAMVEPVTQAFAECVAEVELRAPRLAVVSSVTGDWLSAEEATSPAYWVDQMRQPVRFAQALRTVLGLPEAVLLEASAGTTLSALARHGGAAASRVVPSLGWRPAPANEEAGMLEAAGRLWQLGVPVRTSRLYADPARPRRVPLPSYPFERQRYWLERRRNFRAATPQSARLEATPTPQPTNEQINASLVYGDQRAADRTGRSRPPLAVPYAPPANDIQRRLVALWGEFLGIDDIGIRDNFFALGGDSLLATRVFAAVKREFGVDLPVKRMFDVATVRQIYLFVAVSRDANAIEEFTEEEIDDFTGLAES